MLRRIIGLTILGEAALAFGQTANNTGINVDYLHDSDNTPLLADVMRTYRDVNAIGTEYNTNSLAGSLDSSGWANQDSWYFLGDPNAIAHGDGTYAIKFNGQATIGVGSGVNVLKTPVTSYVTSQVYDPLTNTTTATIQMPTGSDLTQLYLTNTKRTAAASTNTGVTNVQLMRPTTPSGSTPYAFNTTFTNQTVAIASKVNVLRFMDYLATNSSNQVNWSDRVTPNQVQLNPVDPTNPSNSRGKGGPLELAVALGNAANRDIWINIPAKATADYIKNVADLIKYGSDGVNPYTSPQANPVYKPLNPNLHVYVEYSNETWNTSSGFQQNKQLLAMANAEIAGYAGGVGALNFDGSQNDTNLISRFSAEQTKRVADIFASVYGDSAMLTTVRPVLNWQKGNGNATAYQASKILEGYYDNVNGNYVSNPKPISSYIYAGGADAYYSGTVTSSSTVSSIINSADTSTNGQWSTKVRDIAYATTFGIQPVAYEGGLSLYTSDKSLDALKQAALSDPAMRALVVKNHNVWTGMGGNLLIYYFSSDQVNYAFSDANFSTTTQKLQALDDLKNGVASSAYSVGTAVSRSSKTTITGGQFTLTDSYASPYTGTRSLAVGGSMWMSYLLNVPQAGQFALGMDYSLALGTGGFKILLGGAELYSSTTLLGTGKSAALSPILLDLPAGVMSLRVLLNNNSPALAVQDFTLTPYPSVVAIPEPATASLLLVGGTLLMGRKRRK